MSVSNLRGHGLKMFKHHLVTDCDKYSFVNRVVNEWNLLTMTLLHVVQFKIKLDLYLRIGRGLL